MEIIGADPSPTLASLNRRSIKKLYELVDALNPKNDPEMVRACIESVAKLNSSLKGSDILPREETADERAEREQNEAFKEMMSG